MRLIAVIVALWSTVAFGQGLGVINSTRAIDWTKTGLSATFPDGETTTNPWTPPTGRTQCVTAACNTVTANAGSSTPAQINAAIVSASQKSYVLLPCGTYSINANLTFIGSANYLTLRGGGPMCTYLNFSGTNTSIVTSVCCNSAQNANLSASSYGVGTTSLTITGATCGAACGQLAVGNIAFIIECDQGFTGTPPFGGFASTCAGSYSDPYPAGQSPVWQCGRDAPMCNQNNAINGTHAYNQQNVQITNVVNNGAGSYTVTFTPGLYSADWSSTRNAIMWWSNSSDDAFGIGIEDMTIHLVAGGNNKAGLGGACNSWFKGNRLIDGSVNAALSLNRGCHNLEANDYIVASDPAALISNISEAITIGDATTSGGMSDNLFLNNIVTDTLTYWGEGNNSGNVAAYNHARNAQQPDYQTVMLDHFAGQIFELNEGNFFGRYQVDITHGTPNLCLLFRSYVSGDDPPFYTQNPGATQYPGYARFCNALGNAFGGNRSTAYQGNSFSQGDVYAIQNNSDFNGTVDPLVPSGFFRWGNCDVITAGCKFDNTEVPGTLSGNAVPYSQAIPGNHDLPCSFVLVGHTSKPCVPTVQNVGGTGLSWWKVCTNYPTCSTFSIPPFPIAGPELSGGPYVVGFAYDNPAGIAFKTLPIDTSFQSSFTVTASAWSNNGALCSIAGAGTAPAPYTPCMILTVGLGLINNSQSGTVNTQNAATGGCAANCVTWVSGTQFVTGTTWNGQQIQIGSVVYTISSVQSATVLTLTGTPGTQSGSAYYFGMSAEHIMGGFQLVGAAAGCYPSSGISFTNRADNEILITSSSTAKIVYALAADPGANACAVTLKYPDVRQFDEAIYTADTGGAPVISSGSLSGGSITGGVIK